MTDSIRVFDPGFRVTNTSGEPVSGAKCKFYNAGGLVARTVYSDSGLSVSLGSTVTCNASGAPAASGGAGAQVLVYTGTTAYKVVITDSSDNTLFEFDNLSGALDTSSFDADTALPRAPVEIKSTDYTVVDGDRGKVFNVDSTGGDVDVTLPSAVTVGDNWRVTFRHTGTANSVILAAAGGQTVNGASSLTLSYQYESVTLVSDGANFHVSEDAFVRYPAGTVTPQGRLTLTSGTPVITGDVSAASAVYYSPFTGNLVPLYSGTRFVPYEFSELTLTLVSSHVANAIYDVFAFLDGSTLRIGTGPAWSTATAGSGARGLGPGTTQLSRVNGILVNTVQITARNGTDTYTVAASKATHLGSIFMDGTNGQVTCHVSAGQDRKWGVSNAFNRRPVSLIVTDTTASWNYGTNTVRQSNAATGNKATAFCCLQDTPVDAHFRQNATFAPNSDTRTALIAVGVDSTTTVSGHTGRAAYQSSGGSVTGDMVAHHIIQAGILGISNINCLENAPSGQNATFNGGQDDMEMVVTWLA